MKTKWQNPSGTPTYFAWRNMRRRCTDPRDDSYNHYGARGISVCSEWFNSYDNFVRDMGLKPEHTTLERLNTEKGYEPGNCAWVSMRENLNNRRNTVKVNGAPVTIIAESVNLKSDTLRNRVRKGVSIERIFLPRINSSDLAEHGTRARYERAGCRCGLCKAFNANRARIYREKFRQTRGPGAASA
jgi:hypothetical protein